MEGLPWDIQMFSHDETVVCSICKRFSPRDSTTVQVRYETLCVWGVVGNFRVAGDLN